MLLPPRRPRAAIRYDRVVAADADMADGCNGALLPRWLRWLAGWLAGWLRACMAGWIARVLHVVVLSSTYMYM